MSHESPPTANPAEEPSNPAESVDFVYKIDGDNQLGLHELVPILSSLGELIQEGNRVVNPEAPDISISVKPFSEGSFEIELILSPGAVGGLFAFVQAGGAQKIVDVLSNIGLIASKASDAYTSLVGLLKKLGGQPPKEVKEAEKGARYEVTTQRGDVVQVNAPVQNLYQNSTIVQNLTMVLPQPLKKPGRKRIQSYLRDDAQSLVEVVREDVPALADAKPLELQSNDHEAQETEHTNVMFVHPKRGSFEGESTKWSFRKGDRTGEVLQANIKDAAFLKRLERGDLRLSSTDVLKVEMRERQRVVGSDIKTTNEIVRVLEYRPGPIQRKINLDGDESAE